MAAFTQIVEQASDILWNYLLLFLLVGTGIFFTIKLHFVQLSSFADGVRHLFKGFSLHGKAADKDGMSSFQALATAIAAQVGTGNITGCATALVSGGPGALFWTWVSAFFGMATIYAEAVLAQTYRTTVDGQVTGGPAYYIRAAFKGKFGKFLAIFFSVALILALGFMGNMVQSNSIGDAFHNAFGVNRVVVGVVIAVLAAFIFLGGVKRIAAVTAKEPEYLTAEEEASLAAAEAMDDGTTVSLDDLKRELEDYSGKLVLRIPRSLHKALKEAAKVEGVSLNQYMIYKLSH